ncbi:hypothetical protein [Allomuricauda sp. F6463D]|uniref:hypothetical protein n=1 Tax=Allomuricauda sp. F6463D TaxID=2926409 RepID=UPI001FF4CC6D|nr:hypothetical protein [Muricauda sp. F6463D]MCK0161583.1 hypothetical protein [Muricauda sp. F6463D]
MGILLLSTSSTFSQIDMEVSNRLDNFMRESSETSYDKITSESVKDILKYDVFHIVQEIKNTYHEKRKSVNKFIVIDNGLKVKRFERIKTDTSLPELTSYINEDFSLNQETAPYFQGLLDYIYPIAEWKPNNKEYFLKNGKWYFLRDAYFRSKQGFEISVDSNGKITHICYKMRWDEPLSK